MGPEEEENTNYRLTSTVMLTLTTNNESSGTFSLSGSIRRQVLFIIIPSIVLVNNCMLRFSFFLEKAHHEQCSFIEY